jgi:hypothetical protein
MLTRTKMALAGTALAAGLAIPAAASAQTYYDGYAPAYDGYAQPYSWGPTPFWPVNAAAGIVGAAADVVAAPFVGWRDDYYADRQAMPVQYGYGYGYGDAYGYSALPAPPYGDVPETPYASGYGYGYGPQRSWDGHGYVATYRGKVPARHAMKMPARHATMQKHAPMHTSAKAKPATHKHVAAR